MQQEYHLVKDGYVFSEYIVIRTPDYKCTRWFNDADTAYTQILQHAFDSSALSYGAHVHKNQHIIDVLKNNPNRKLIKTFTPTAYPELFL